MGGVQVPSPANITRAGSSTDRMSCKSSTFVPRPNMAPNPLRPSSSSRAMIAPPNEKSILPLTTGNRPENSIMYQA